MAAKREIVEEWYKLLDGRLDHLREIAKDLEESITYCRGSDVVSNWGKFIDFTHSFREAGTFARSMEDITEEDWDKYKGKLAEIEDKAVKIVGTFAIHCICQVKLE